MVRIWCTSHIRCIYAMEEGRLFSFFKHKHSLTPTKGVLENFCQIPLNAFLLFPDNLWWITSLADLIRIVSLKNINSRIN